MNHKKPISPPINLFILFFSLLARKSLGVVDQYFQDCVPKSCGDGQNISFPFYIQNQQKSFCGYPGFELSCSNNGHPTLKISNNNYIIHQISYQTQTVRVSNAAFSNSNISCTPSIRNISLPNDQFELVPHQTDLFLLYDCNSSLLESPLQFYTDCYGEKNKTRSVLALHKQDSRLSDVKKKCKTGVVTPVEAYYGGENGGIGKVLRNGFVLKWKASNCSICEESGGKCGFNSTTYQFRCFCRDRPHSRRCTNNPDKIKKKVVLAISIGLPAILIIACCFFIRRHYKKKYASTMLARNISSRSDMEVGSFYFGASVFSYSELKEATNNFDIEKELGDGGFGTVYYGKLRDGREVAVKRLYEHNYRRVEQFMNEIEILTKLRHKNLVSLYGCTSRHSRELLLVYEYIPNGTVADHIHGERATPGSPTWPTRMSIAIETASALAYLHASDIIHRDVKTNNILLDNSFCVKVADFGLSRLFPTNVTHVSTAPQGTPGYVDPEYHQRYQLTIKSDVYSFGVVLIELISSLPAVDITRHWNEINLANLAINKIQNCEFNELIDLHLGFESDNEVKRMTISVANLAFQCLQPDKETRPSMVEVLEALKKIQSGEDESEDREKADDDAGVLKPPTSPDSYEAGLLKKTQLLPPSPDSVTDIDGVEGQLHLMPEEMLLQ